MTVERNEQKNNGSRIQGRAECAAEFIEFLPQYSLLCGKLETPSQSLLGKFNFRHLNLVTFC